jgi:hypothetical protein
MLTDKLPEIAFPSGVRIPADVTIELEGDDRFTEETAVDVAPGKMMVYFRVQGHIRSMDFRFVTGNRLFHLCSSWFAASLGRALPIAQHDLQRQGHASVHIEPPWPLDFRLSIQTRSHTDADRIWSIFTTQQLQGLAR